MIAGRQLPCQRNDGVWPDGNALETVRQGHVRDHWRIWRDGRLIHAEAFRLDGQIVQKLNHKASAAGKVCFATTIYISCDAEAKATRRCEGFHQRSCRCANCGFPHGKASLLSAAFAMTQSKLKETFGPIYGTISPNGQPACLEFTRPLFVRQGLRVKSQGDFANEINTP